MARYVKYAIKKEEFIIGMGKASKYMDGFATGELSYNNSSHRQTAIQKYQYALERASKISDKERIKKQIHFLQAG